MEKVDVKTIIYNAFTRMFASERGSGLTFRDKWDKYHWISQDIHQNQVQYNCFYGEEINPCYFGLNLEFKSTWEALSRADSAALQDELRNLPNDYFFEAYWEEVPRRVFKPAPPIGTIPRGPAPANKLNIGQFINQVMEGKENDRPDARWQPHLMLYATLSQGDENLTVNEYLQRMRSIREHLSAIETLITV